MLELPSPQFPDPEALVAMRLTTHVLVAALLVFGMGSGWPKGNRVSPGTRGY